MRSDFNDSDTEESVEIGTRDDLVRGGTASHGKFRTRPGEFDWATTEGLCSSNAGQPTVSVTAIEARSLASHDRQHRNFSACDFQRPEFRRGLLHGRQCARLHPDLAPAGNDQSDYAATA